MDDLKAAIDDYHLLIEKLGRNEFIDGETIDAVIADAGMSFGALEYAVAEWRASNSPTMTDVWAYDDLVERIARRETIDMPTIDAICGAAWVPFAELCAAVDKKRDELGIEDEPIVCESLEADLDDSPESVSAVADIDNAVDGEDPYDSVGFPAIFAVEFSQRDARAEYDELVESAASRDAQWTQFTIAAACGRIGKTQSHFNADVERRRAELGSE